MGWNGKRVFVTGASSGIGAAVAREMAAAGATVGMCARRKDLLEAVLDDCRGSVGSCVSFVQDLSRIEELDDFARQVESELGRVDVLVNNAGLSKGGTGLEMPWEDVEYLTRLNYLSPVRLTRAFLPAMLERGKGQILTVSSMAARMSSPGEAAYGGSKAALTAFFEALAGELEGRGVTFHLVYPGLIDLTPGVDGDDVLAETQDGSLRVPAPVLARDIRRQLERGDMELYMPYIMRDFAVNRMQDVPASISFMGDLFRSGRMG